jgi:ornithine cyclodeaminase/alanine dehydrogenase-like protein (mu-crystallin family)
MIVFDEAQTRAALPYPELIDALADMFAQGCEMPVRHHHEIGVRGEPDATLLLMPAWQAGKYLGVKIATVFPGNAGRGQPAINASYVLISARTGQVVALLDGGELTARRTAAASALAARHLARPDARHLLVIGTGRLALNLVEAHSVVRDITSVAIWGRDRQKAGRVAAAAASPGIAASAAGNLETAMREADIISCATLSAEPLVEGAWLRPGTHVDVVGAFKPDMRESDDDVMRKASVFVDTRAGAMKEAGDILQALASGAISATDIRAELAELCLGTHAGRTSDDEITVFKSVGAALEDLAGAMLAYEKVGK